MRLQPVVKIGRPRTRGAPAPEAPRGAPSINPPEPVPGSTRTAFQTPCPWGTLGGRQERRCVLRVKVRENGFSGPLVTY